MHWLVFVAGILWCHPILALTEVSLAKEVAEVTAFKKVDWAKKPVSPLAVAKFHELLGQGEECLAALKSAKVKDLDSWIDLQRMRCHFWVIKKQKNEKAWSDLKKFIESSQLLKGEKKQVSLAWEDLDGFLLAHSEELDEWYIELLADSLEHLQTRDRDRVLNFLSRKKGLWSEWVTTVRPPGPEVTPLAPASKDKEFDFQFQDKTQKTVKIETVLKYLNEFPAGEKAKGFEIELKSRLQKSETQWNKDLLALRPELQLELLSSLLKRDSGKIVEGWLKGFRQRQEPLSAGAWLTLGRQAQTFGLFDEAKLIFTTLVERYSQSPEAAEALFRRALVNMRLALWEPAQTDLTALLENSRYALSAGYWLAQVLKKGPEKDRARVSEVAQTVIDRFPLSYYGLKLREELKQPLTLTKPSQGTDARWLLTAADRQAWARAKQLMKFGWTREANLEVKALPWPADPTSLWQLSQLLADRGVYQQAFSSHSLLTEGSAEHRLPAELPAYFPKVWESRVNEEAQRQRLSPYLVWGLMRQESAFNERATSTSAALGLMQLLFSTAKDVASSFSKNLVDPEDLYLPGNNIQFGTKYMGQMIDICKGSVPLAVASYNAGPGRVQQWFRLRDDLKIFFEGAGLTKEMMADPMSELWVEELPIGEPSFYVKAVLRNALLYRWLYSTPRTGPALGLGQWRDLQSRVPSS